MILLSRNSADGFEAWVKEDFVPRRAAHPGPPVHDTVPDKVLGAHQHPDPASGELLSFCGMQLLCLAY